MSIEVCDAYHQNSKTHLIFLERKASKVPPDLTGIYHDFANHPESHLIRDIIQSHPLSNSSHSTVPAVLPSDQDQSIPLVRITPSRSSNSLALTPPITLSMPSLVDVPVASLASAHVIRGSKAKTIGAWDLFVV